MVWPFKKRGDVIDLTYLAKRGLLNVPEQEEYKDLTPQAISEPESSNSDFSFLGAMASSAEPASTAESTAKRPTPGISSNKIEDIEFKLDTITKRVNTMLDRLDLVEKKLSRDLRQSS